MERPEDLQGRKVTVMGLGVFGGGAGVARFLVEQGARVTVTDLRKAEDLSKGMVAIQDLPLSLVLGEHRPEDFTQADLIVVNPAVPSDSPYLRLASDSGVPLESEINMTLMFLGTRRVVGVTGSNGKTTTSHLLYRMVKAAGETAWLGGNVGGSLLPHLSRIKSNDVVVLELSSFQLERAGSKGLGPNVGVVTNITPNHLDRHKTFSAYLAAKAQIFVNARGAVLNAEDPVSAEKFGSLKIPTLRYSSKRELEEGYFIRDRHIVERMNHDEKEIISLEEVRLPGVFNLENIMAALAGTRLILECPALPSEVCETAASFQGVPHRLEEVARKKGTVYINDSIATTPESCLAALDAVEGTIHLIAGGYDKSLPLERLAEGILHRAGSVLLIGDTADKLAEAISRAARKTGITPPRVEKWSILEKAVLRAARIAGPGSTVLLSPGFASYDQFQNFEERGECFRRYIKAI